MIFTLVPELDYAVDKRLDVLLDSAAGHNSNDSSGVILTTESTIKTPGS